jgi:pyrroline-5-carboxylate reductase
MTSTAANAKAPSGRIAIIGGGNIGTALAKGLVGSGQHTPDRITITRRQTQLLEDMAGKGFKIQADNRDAVRDPGTVVVAVLPQQLPQVLQEIGPHLTAEKHTLISLVSGASIKEILRHLGKAMPVVRAMPNTAIAIRESMTCLASMRSTGDNDPAAQRALDIAKSLFDTVGRTLIINEELMIPATALCACGIAFFLRSIRAASQGGIEIGFHPDEALLMAAQTAKGAASLLLGADSHPESEIDRVTTPRGCTIAGLNQMEHEGFSSAMIKGITTSAEKAAGLYVNANNS